MKAAAIPFGTIGFLEVEPQPGAPLEAAWAAGLEVVLRAHADGAALSVPGLPLATLVRGKESAQAAALTAALSSPWPRITTIAKRLGNSLVLRNHEFTAILHWPEALAIGFGDKLSEVRKRMRNHAAGVEQVAAWLREQLLLPALIADRPPRAFVSAGEAAADAARPFRLHGPDLTVDIRADSGGRLQITRLIDNASPAARLAMVELKLGFGEPATTAPLSPVARGQLELLVAGTGQYLELWNQYGMLERQRLNDEIRKTGNFRYRSWRRIADNDLEFLLADHDPGNAGDLKSLREACSKPDFMLEAATEPPKFLSEEADEQSEDSARPRRRSRRRQGGAFGRCSDNDIDLQRGTIVLHAEEGTNAPPPTGYLFLSKHGHRIAMERREEAQNSIRTGNAVMPQLGPLLENQPVAIAARPRVEPVLTEATLQQFAGGSPTPFQALAVDIAVNTPDIAVIQGPPGTGKTQVIAAIVKRLEELADPEVNPIGLFLLTSYQHVAVENVAERVRPFGLPALKRGRRKQAGNPGGEATTTISSWKQATIDHLERRKRQFDNERVATFKQLHGKLHFYVTGYHRLQETARLLDEATDLAATLVTTETWNALREKADGVRRDLRESLLEVPLELDRAYAAVAALRYRGEAFEDDGPLTADKALRALTRLQGKLDAGAPKKEPLLSAQERDLLMEAADPQARASDALLTRLGQLRERMLKKLAPDRRPISTRLAPRADIGQALANAVSEARRRLSATRAGIGLVLDDYLTELRQNEWRLDEALGSYTAARAETCQGSASHMIASQRKNGRAHGFETVIVDEAARANPLDLLIPMAQARRRIILVGDHKQLPHTLEPDLEKAMKQTVSEEAVAALRMSLFERLFKDLEDREKAGEPRRTVTLDVQFRMHSCLGAFVSRVFYRGRVRSNPERDAQLAHGLSRFRKEGQERVAAWIDVPARDGPGKDARKLDEELPGMSKSRPAEIPPIRAAIEDILAEKPDYKIGVISFYSEQVRLLRQRLADLGPNVLVGTVDALQGKEYPIVFLSMTRCNHFASGPIPADGRERDLTLDEHARKRYGFLMLENRMCVALSRQQRLLVVVGDRAMLGYPEAGRAIPPLRAFDELCGTENGMRLAWIRNEFRIQ